MEKVYFQLYGFTTDLHSLAVYSGWYASLLETFLVIDQVETQLTVPSGLDFGDGLEYLEGDSFHSINKKFRIGTIEAHCEGSSYCYHSSTRFKC